jgi:hypothetical protein
MLWQLASGRCGDDGQAGALLPAAARGGECLGRAEFMQPSSRRAFCSRAPARRVALLLVVHRDCGRQRFAGITSPLSTAGAIFFSASPPAEVSFLEGAPRRNVLQWQVELNVNCSLWPASCASPMRPDAPCAFLLAGCSVTCIFASAPTA